MPEGRCGYPGDVVTFKPIGMSPAQAWGQLDYVSTTEHTADRVAVGALNFPDEWGQAASLASSFPSPET